MSILIVFGTRPEYLKIKPLVDELTARKLEFYTLFTGQHKDIVQANPDFPLSVALPEPPAIGNRLVAILAHTTFNLSQVLDVNPHIKFLLVQGDTSSALAGALAAINHKVKIIHLEAGLRTYDFENPYPEEYNRQLISKITDIHLCPTEENKKNLLNERVNGDVYVVGNTILDTLVSYIPEIEYNNQILVTLHRRENHDKIEKWFKEINRLAMIYDDYEFIFPIHPNPNVQKHKHLLTNVKVIEPLAHDEFIKMLVKCRMVISDSGGIQEECSFFKKKVIVCRKITERPESVGTTSILCAEPEKLISLFRLHNYETNMSQHKCPYGDGTSSKQIVDIFEREIYMQ
jgi:UDP-N-acetylglucosamine 2-epimerase (non-hydrolysing)